MPAFIMLIGLPGSGKSTFCSGMEKALGATVLSTDDFVERRAAEQGKTYNDVWAETVGEAEKVMWTQFREATEAGKDIIVDRTNLTVKVRNRYLSKLPDGYTKIAVLFMVDDDTLDRRLASRPGKVIPAASIENMRRYMVLPSPSEGFDVIVMSDSVDFAGGVAA